MNKVLISEIERKFCELESARPMIIRSPGRINFIGEHTDYNDGFVLPAAIDKSVYFAAAKNDTGLVKILSADFNQKVEINLNNVQKTRILWADYLAGTLKEMQKMDYPIEGFTCVFGGDIPQGAGLSSSAAVASGFAFLINEIFEFNIPKTDLAYFAQKAEHNFTGVNCGIMDQFINLHAEKNKALNLDCRSLDYEMYDFDFPGLEIILCDSGIKHSLAATEYNLRSRQCELGIMSIRKKYPQVKKLRDVDIFMIEEFKNLLPAKIYSRCLYVVEENYRVREATKFLKKKDICGFGGLMSLTHEGLRIDYEVSIPELDNLVYQALDHPGVHGSRMMGGGFGGCTINLVEKEQAGPFKEKINNLYQESDGIKVKFYDCKLESGTSVIMGE
jgi:galactokinase